MSGRAGETLTYTADGKLATAAGTSTLPVNPNPSATGGTPPAPVAGAGSTGTRYYDAGGNLVGLTDGTGTTITIGSITAHSTPAGVKTVTKTYTFAGKAIGQRTAVGGVVKLAFILSDGVDTAQTIVQPTSGATLVTAQTRYTDPMGLARGPTQTATGNAAYATAPAGVNGVGSNAANPNGYGAPNGYIGGLADTISTLTHLDPVPGAFTSPDPVLKPGEAKNFSPYIYGEADAINNSDPSGLMILGPQIDAGGSWFGAGANVEAAAPYVPDGPYAPGYTSPVPGSWQSYISRSWTPPRTTPTPPSNDNMSAFVDGLSDPDGLMAYERQHGSEAALSEAFRWLSFDAAFVPGVGGIGYVALNRVADSVEGKDPGALSANDVGMMMIGAVPGADDIGALAKLGKAAKSADGLAKLGFRSDTSHIFRDGVGHLAEDTAANRNLIRGAISPETLKTTITLKDGSTSRNTPRRCLTALKRGPRYETELKSPAEASMSSPDDRPPEELLSKQEAFKVMIEFLWQYARRAGDDLITLLGDVELEADGQPSDPAAWDDWLECIQHVKDGLPPRREEP